jgi:hypothetical protein
VPVVFPLRIEEVFHVKSCVSAVIDFVLLHIPYVVDNRKPVVIVTRAVSASERERLRPVHASVSCGHGIGILAQRPKSERVRGRLEKPGQNPRAARSGCHRLCCSSPAQAVCERCMRSGSYTCPPARTGPAAYYAGKARPAAIPIAIESLKLTNRSKRPHDTTLLSTIAVLL